MTKSGIPYVRVEIVTDEATADLLAQARRIQNAELPTAVHVSTNKAMRITVAVDAGSHGFYLKYCGGIEGARAQIIENLKREAQEVMALHQLMGDIRGIPAHLSGDAYGQYTLVVHWTLEQAARVYLANMPNVRVARLSDAQDGRVWMAACLPESVFAEAVMNQIVDASSQTLSDLVYTELMENWRTLPHDEIDDEKPLPKPRRKRRKKQASDDDIPF